MSERPEETVVCRCEDVTLEDVRKALDDGCLSMDEIKRVTRCTMGPCQGKTCRLLLLGEIARRAGRRPEEVGMSTFRPPTKPVKIGLLAVASSRKRKRESGR